MFHRIGIDGGLYRTVEQQQAASLVVWEAKFLDKHTRTTIYKLGISELHIHHLVAFHSAKPYHNRGRNHVAHHLLPRTRLHARAACHILWPHDNLYGNFSSLAHRRTGIGGYGGCQASCGTSLPQCAYNVRRGSRCRYAYHCVAAVNAVRKQVGPPLVGIIFGILHRVAQGSVASGYDAYIGSMPNVGGTSEASSTPSLPDVPAPM